MTTILFAHSETGAAQNRRTMGRTNLADHQISTVLNPNACMRPILSRWLGRLALGVAVFSGSLLNGWSSERQQDFLAPDPVRVFGPAHVADPAALPLPAMPLEIEIDIRKVVISLSPAHRFDQLEVSRNRNRWSFIRAHPLNPWCNFCRGQRVHLFSGPAAPV